MVKGIQNLQKDGSKAKTISSQIGIDIKIEY
jgi:hypothetical protein